MVTNSRKDTLQNGRVRGKRKAQLRTTYAEPSGPEDDSNDEEDFEPSSKMRKRSTSRTPSRSKSTVSRNKKTRTPANLQQRTEEDIRENCSESNRNSKGKSNGAGRTVQEISSPYFLGNTSKPLLSESESSDEEMSIADIKKTLVDTKSTVRNKAEGAGKGKVVNTPQIEANKTMKLEKVIGNKPAGKDFESSKLKSIKVTEKAAKEKPKATPQIEPTTIKAEKIIREDEPIGKDLGSPKSKRIKQTAKAVKETPKAISSGPCGTKILEKANSIKTVKKGKQSDGFENVEHQVQCSEEATSIASATRGKRSGNVKRRKGKANLEVKRVDKEEGVEKCNVKMEVDGKVKIYAKKGVTKKGGKGQDPKKNNKEPLKSLKTTGKVAIKKEMAKGKKEKSSIFDKGLVENRPGPSGIKMEMNSGSSDESDSEDDWEDVHEADFSKEILESPKKKAKKEAEVKDVSINLKVKSIHKSKSKKGKEKFMECVQRTMRKFQNQVQTNLHKDHLVCLVARMQFLNSQCNDNAMKAICLSMIPLSFTKVSVAKWDISLLAKFVNWFPSGWPDLGTLLNSYNEISGSSRQFTKLQMFIAMLRAVGLLARLVMSLQPITWKVDNAALFRFDKTEKKETEPDVKIRSKSPVRHLQDSKKRRIKDESPTKDKAKTEASPSANSSVSPYFKTEEMSDTEIKEDLHANEKVTKGGKKSSQKKISSKKSISEKFVSEKPVAKKTTTSKSVATPRSTVYEKRTQKSATAKSENGKSTKKATPRRKQTDSTPIPISQIDSSTSSRKRKLVSYKGMDDCSDVDTDHSDFEQNTADSSDEEEGFEDFVDTPTTSLSGKLSKKASQSSGEKAKKSVMPSVSRGYAMKLMETIDNDDDFEKTSKPVKRRRSSNNKSESPKVKVISSDSESCHSEDSPKFVSKSSASGTDTWCEVYLKSMKKWICIELESKAIDNPAKCEKLASQPLQYVLGIDNENAIKDVTCRYATKFMSKTRKLRIDREWWAETLQPYETKQKKLEELEDTELRMNLMKQPFPASLGEFKNHPLYVLEEHLLKFEAIYPQSAAILGYIRKKPIYSRDCVHILHTRENWIKEARVVKQGEERYKLVKGRPKRNTPIHERDKVMIELFGLWQTEVYKPPPVVDGKVPRNEYGNVELFQPSMLPPGGVHVPILGIQKIARRLGIDAAPAMMGWDFHGGYCHPIIEGVVVAAEYEEKLLDAWQKDEDEREKRAQEKNEKKILDRWKMMVKGLLVRDRIRRKYDFRETEEFEHAYVSHKDGDEKESTDVAISWPLNKMEGTTALNDKGHCHIFPESSHKQSKITGEWTKSCTCGLTMAFEKL